MLKRLSFLCGIGLLVYSLGFFPASPAHANIFETMKEIYHLPDKMSELQEKYDEAARMISEQQQKLAEMQQYSETLAAQNSELTKQLEQMNRERAELRRNLISAAVAAAGIAIAYILSIRIWRYMAWRKHKGHNGEMFGS
ncbi:hypothetical protein [Paenibacillus ginsengihumi]|uniref:hypothetical protein n=1 Tax=Paenibacillus ginsengihumi TaxID=431596 RepID=UPI000377ADE8|nr:hypothetical protein [Paenibacillus ginsengihumi]